MLLRRIFLLCLTLALVPLLAAQQKHALVIGNAAYTAPLNNPVNDATDIAAMLQSMGFQVETVLNGSLDLMETAMTRLKDRLSADSSAYGFFYYAGHGVQFGGENYLIPMNATISNENLLRQRAMSMQFMFDELNDAGNVLNIVVLDACRDNPFSWGRSVGLEAVTNPQSIVVYATSAGQTVLDSDERNGVFVSQLLKHLGTPGLEVHELFNRTEADVRQISNQVQMPTVYSQLLKTVYLNGKAPAPVQLGTLLVTAATGGALTVTGGGINQSANLSAGGNWNRADLAAGPYRVTLQYADGKSENRTVSITGGQATAVNFAAQPASVASPPAPPQNVRAGTPGTDRVTLNWDSAGADASYWVHWSTENNPSSAKALGNPTTGLSMSIISLARGANYYFWVSTIKDGQESVKSPAVTVVAIAPANMVWVAGGTFAMGSPSSEAGRDSDEGPQHQVTISKGFYMGKYEVTQKEWVAVMGSNPSYFKGDNLPVEQVSWFDVIDYCNALSRREGLTPAYTISGSGDSRTVTWNKSANGYRLPTEAEWEYACRAGTTSPFSTGNNITTSQANYDGNYPYNNNAKGTYRSQTTAVGSFAANSWGLHDMHGNVWEWCWDRFGDYASGFQTDPSGAASGADRG
jgi:formylglycine-generating enzyme required for sulfatase activity